MRVVDLAAVIAEIEERQPTGPTRVIGIDGPAGSGKSTLARRLVTRLGAARVTTDDFLSWGDLRSWWPRFEAEVLTPLVEGRDARYQIRDWANDPEGDSVQHWRTTTWAPTVVLEGVSSTRREVAERLAYRIWVEAPDELRLQRGLARDGDYWHDHWVDWREMEAEFFATDGTRDRADLLVDGAPGVPYDPETQVVIR
jgi:uridine kinase